MTPVERAEILTKVSQAIQADMQAFAELITTEMGSPWRGRRWRRSSHPP